MEDREWNTNEFDTIFSSSSAKRLFHRISWAHGILGRPPEDAGLISPLQVLVL